MAVSDVVSAETFRTVSPSVDVRPQKTVPRGSGTSSQSREGFVLIALSVLLLLISAALFAILFTLLSEELAALSTVTGGGASDPSATNTAAKPSGSLAGKPPTAPPVVKPPLLCAVTVPTVLGKVHLSSGSVNDTLDALQFCDYVVLDTKQENSQGYFVYTNDYTFVAGKASKVLFTLIPEVLSNGGRGLLHPKFVMSVEQARNIVPLRGFGFLDTISELLDVNHATYTVRHLKGVYMKLDSIMAQWQPRVPDAERLHFLTFSPVNRQSSSHYLNVLTSMSSVKRLIIIIKTVLPPHPLVVEAPSSFDTTCFAEANKSTMMEAVNMVRNITAPEAMFALSVSMNLYYFYGAKFNRLLVDRTTNTLADVTYKDYTTLRFAEKCGQEIYAKPYDPTHFFEGGCIFKEAAKSGDLVSYENSTSLLKKMKKVSDYLERPGYQHQVLGWLAENVTGGVQPASGRCGNTAERLRKMCGFLKGLPYPGDC